MLIFILQNSHIITPVEQNSSPSQIFKKNLGEVRKKIGMKIRQRRKQVDLDTKNLAQRVGLSQGSISNIEKGKQSITAERLWQFSIALSCSPHELLPPVPDELKEFDKNLKKLENEEAIQFAKDIIIATN